MVINETKFLVIINDKPVSDTSELKLQNVLVL